jgi:hypothetical protein
MTRWRGKNYSLVSKDTGTPSQNLLDSLCILSKTGLYRTYTLSNTNKGIYIVSPHFSAEESSTVYTYLCRYL